MRYYINYNYIHETNIYIIIVSHAVVGRAKALVKFKINAPLPSLSCLMGHVIKSDGSWSDPFSERELPGEKLEKKI